MIIIVHQQWYQPSDSSNVENISNFECARRGFLEYPSSLKYWKACQIIKEFWKHENKRVSNEFVAMLPLSEVKTVQSFK